MGRCKNEERKKSRIESDESEYARRGEMGRPSKKMQCQVGRCMADSMYSKSEQGRSNGQ